MSVAVLLATYQGEAFLEEQIESLLNQTFSEFTIHVSDDLSDDRTVSILEAYAHRLPQKFVLHKKNNRLGVKDHFFFLLKEVSASYLFFCDQDDVWHPSKMERLMSKMHEMESRFGSIPLLVHCNLRVVSESLEVIHPSFWSFMGIEVFEPHKIDHLLRYDAVTGCALLINKELKQLILPMGFPIMHDAWLALGASLFGQIGVVKEALVDYRQHKNNVIGAKPVTFFKKLRDRVNRHIFGRSLRKERAQLLLKHFDVKKEEREIILEFLKK
jgi:glycosyltransferase involved in cell wall biosynthesis